jgi:hypothetical protein
MMYASVVSRESVHIDLALAALNDLEVKMVDIKNTYLMTPTTEKTTMLGPDFEYDCGNWAIIVQYLYSLKYGGTAFRNHLVEFMQHLGWELCMADCDLWMKAETRPDDGVTYYAYILIYVDNILCLHHGHGGLSCTY